MGWLEERKADLNLFDGGRSGKDVRKENSVEYILQKKRDEQTMNSLRQKADQRLKQQASTGTIPIGNVPGFGVRKPQINQQMAYQQRQKEILFDGNASQFPKAIPNVNLNRGFFNKAAFSPFDANSDMDKLNRANEGRNPDYRQSEIDRGNLRPMMNFGQGVVGNTARLVNTVGQAGQSIPLNVRIKTAQATGNMPALEQALKETDSYNKNFSSGRGGLLNAGNFLYNNEQDLKMSTGEALKRSGLNAVGTASELLPFKINPLKKAGLATRLAANAGIDTLLGAGESSARQYLQTGQVDAKTLVADSVGNALLGAVPTALTPQVKPKAPLSPELLSKRNGLVNAFTVAQDSGRPELANGIAKQIDAIDNPPKGSLREQIRTAKERLTISNKQSGFVGDAIESQPTIKNALGEEVPNPNFKASVQDALEGKSTKIQTDAKPDKYVKEYANILRGMDEDATGGQMIPSMDGGYKRISEHSDFYRNFFKENKRKPALKDYVELAKEEMLNDQGFMKYVEEDKLAEKPLSNKPSTRMTVAEKESLFNSVPQGTDKQIKVRTPNDAKSVKVNKLVANEELPTIDTKRVSNLDKAFRSTRSVIERQGEKGSELAGGLQKARDTQELYLADLQKQMPSVTKLARSKAIGKNSINNKDFENFVDATQGLAEPKNELVAQAIKEWQATHPAIRQRAVDAGLEVGDLGPNYYPHFIDYDEVFKNKNTYNQSLNHLVKTGQAKNVEEAIKLLGYARDVSRNRQFGNLEASRLVDLPFYDKTPNSFISYLNGSTKRIAQTETFGKGDEKALKLIADAGQQGYDTEAMKNAYDVAVGAKQYNPTASKISGGIRKYVTTTRLGLGALTNVAQNVNTGVVTGHMRTLGAMVKQFDPKTREFARDTGVISDALLNDLKTQQGYSSFTSKVLGKGINKVTAPFFGTVERFNRAVSATAGRDYALRLAQKGDEKTLRKLGVTGTIDKELTEAQQIQAARKIVEKTQFKVDSQDLPGWADSPGGKLVSQFRTFSYKQGSFISNEVLKPAAKGDLMPLGRLMAALPVGYALYETKRVIAGRPEEEDKKKQALSVFQNIGGAGLVFDLYQSLNPIGSKYIPSDRRASMAAGAIGGPAVGVAMQGVGALSEAIQRKNTPKDPSRLDGKVAVANNGEDYTDLTALARFGIQQIPAVGTPIKNRLLPFKKEAEADAGKNANDPDVKIAESTTKDASGEYATRDKYDALINAYTKSDTLKPELSVTETTNGNIQKYDNKELSNTVKSVAEEASLYLESKGITGVKADSKLAVLYAKFKKSEAQDPEKSFFTALGKAYPETKEQTTSKATKPKKTASKSSSRKSGRRSSGATARKASSLVSASINNSTLQTYKNLDRLLSGGRGNTSVDPPKITARKAILKQIKVRA